MVKPCGFSACPARYSPVHCVLVSKHVRQLDKGFVEAAVASMFRRSHAREQYDMLSSPSKYKATRARQKARGVICSMRRHWQPCAQCVLWALLVASVICFWCITFLRPTAWYRDDTGGHFRPLWDTLELRSVSGAETASPPIMKGMISTQVSRHQVSLKNPGLLHRAPEVLCDYPEAAAHLLQEIQTLICIA